MSTSWSPFSQLAPRLQLPLRIHTWLSTNSYTFIDHETAQMPEASGVKRPRNQSDETGKRRAPYALRACDTCRRRKVKCDGSQPCAACTGRHDACCYSGDLGFFMPTPAAHVQSRQADAAASTYVAHLFVRDSQQSGKAHPLSAPGTQNTPPSSRSCRASRANWTTWRPVCNPQAKAGQASQRRPTPEGGRTAMPASRRHPRAMLCPIPLPTHRQSRPRAFTAQPAQTTV